ncbi:MAG: diacylglycerol kinase family lipid kinase [Acetobacteraceae bacterium]|nr:diacylglycerol kinase family lipid kinase [Acetobacteraceae bacterium]
MVATYPEGFMRIVFNPTAGGARRPALERALAALRGAGLHPELLATEAPGHAEVLARAARPGEIVVAAGGDGTIAEVAAGIAGSGAVLGILPLGTANVLAREVGLPLDPVAAAAALAAGPEVRLHAGLARGASGTRLFVQMVGAGFDAAVVHALPLTLKRRLGRGAYVLQSLRETIRHRFAPIRVQADDDPPFEAASAIVTKGRLYAGPFTVAPGADPARPGFTLVTFDHGGAPAALLAGAALPLGLIPRLPGVRLRRVARVTLDGEGVPAQADGDAAGFLPLTITALPAPIPLRLGFGARGTLAAPARVPA